MNRAELLSELTKRGIAHDASKMQLTGEELRVMRVLLGKQSPDVTSELAAIADSANLHQHEGTRKALHAIVDRLRGPQ